MIEPAQSSWLNLVPEDVVEEARTRGVSSVARKFVLQNMNGQLTFVKKGGILQRLVRVWNQLVHRAKYDFQANLQELHGCIGQTLKNPSQLDEETGVKLYYVTKTFNEMVGRCSPGKKSPPSEITLDSVRGFCQQKPNCTEFDTFVLNSVPDKEVHGVDPVSHLIALLSTTHRRHLLEAKFENVKTRLEQLSKLNLPEAQTWVLQAKEDLGHEGREAHGPERRLSDLQRMLSIKEKEALGTLPAELDKLTKEIVEAERDRPPGCPEVPKRAILEAKEAIEKRLKVDAQGDIEEFVQHVTTDINAQRFDLERWRHVEGAIRDIDTLQLLPGSLLAYQLQKLRRRLCEGSGTENLDEIRNELETYRPLFDLDRSIRERIDEIQRLDTRGPISKKIAEEMVAKLRLARNSLDAVEMGKALSQCSDSEFQKAVSASAIKELQSYGDPSTREALRAFWVKMLDVDHFVLPKDVSSALRSSPADLYQWSQDEGLQSLERRVRGARLLDRALAGAEASLVNPLQKARAEYQLLLSLASIRGVESQPRPEFVDVMKLLHSHDIASTPWKVEDLSRLREMLLQFGDANKALKQSLPSDDPLVQQVFAGLEILKKAQETNETLEPLAHIPTFGKAQYTIKIMNTTFVRGCVSLNGAIASEDPLENVKAVLAGWQKDFKDSDLRLGLELFFPWEEWNAKRPNRKTLEEFLRLGAQGRREYLSSEPMTQR